MTPFPLLIAFLAALAQDSRQGGEFKITTTVELVLLDVSVKGQGGGYLSGLTKDKFQVYENEVPQNITEFTSADIPVAVGLVMDASGSMRSKRSELITAGVAFVEASNPRDQIFIVNFNDTVRSGLPESVPFTDDINLLRAALSKDRPDGRTALYDAIAFSLHHLEFGRRGKKALLVVSDGGDNISTHTFTELMQLIQESSATVYTVGIFAPDDPDRNPHVLKHIAKVSGGECFLPGELRDIVPICRRIAKDIRNRYTIGYIPVRTSAKAALRKIRVVAAAPDGAKLIVHTRTSYLLPEAVSAAPEEVPK